MAGPEKTLFFDFGHTIASFRFAALEMFKGMRFSYPATGVKQKYKQGESLMAWIYNVITNSFYLNGRFQFKAMYAGAPGYKNNTEFECLKHKGPLPRGTYRIGHPQALHPSAGKYVLRLTPYPGNNMCNRDGFLIHGDNGKGTASTGCIIVTLHNRQKIAESRDQELIVQ